jgi:hypothetical protein
MNHFCTYCDKGYAARLLCLHDSLLRHGGAFQLTVLCFDAETAAVVAAARQPTLTALILDELLHAEPDYAAVRARRSPVEFYFTTTPVLLRHCLARSPAASQMTYLDADLFFFGPASAVLAEQAEASIGIVPHRFPARLSDRLKYGTYNVAWVSFRRDREGLAGLDWWRARCLEWCHDRIEGGRFADQGYLDEFPRRFAGVRALDHPGINAAPWNMDEVGVKAGKDEVFVNERPLLFYHFQGIREVTPGWFEPGLRGYGTRLTAGLRDLVYLPYLRALVSQQRALHARHGITPRFVYQRLNTGDGWADRWERAKARWLLPHYGRMRGQLLHVGSAPEPAAALEAE